MSILIKLTIFTTSAQVVVRTDHKLMANKMENEVIDAFIRSTSIPRLTIYVTGLAYKAQSICRRSSILNLSHNTEMLYHNIIFF